MLISNFQSSQTLSNYAGVDGLSLPTFLAGCSDNLWKTNLKYADVFCLKQLFGAGARFQSGALWGHPCLCVCVWCCGQGPPFDVWQGWRDGAGSSTGCEYSVGWTWLFVTVSQDATTSRLLKWRQWNESSTEWVSFFDLFIVEMHFLCSFIHTK